jgi:hypothetical protein
MDEQVVKVLLAGPFYALAAVQIFGPHKLWSRDSLRIFLWGMLFAVVAPPLLALVGVIAIQKPGPEPIIERIWQMGFIWLMLFTLAAVARIGVMMVKFAWRRRPRPQPIRPPEPAPREPATPPPPPPVRPDTSGLPH